MLKAVVVKVLAVLSVGMLVLAFTMGGGYVQAEDTWHIETVDSVGNVGEYTSIALGSRDRPHISYLDDINRDLKYAYKEPPPAVGGIWIPVDKLGLLAPYIGLVSTIIVGMVATTIYAKRINRRKENN